MPDEAYDYHTTLIHTAGAAGSCLVIITTNLIHRQAQDGEDLIAATPLMNAISRIPRTTTNLVTGQTTECIWGRTPQLHIYIALIMNVISRIPRATIIHKHSHLGN